MKLLLFVFAIVATFGAITAEIEEENVDALDYTDDEPSEDMEDTVSYTHLTLPTIYSV